MSARDIYDGTDESGNPIRKVSASVMQLRNKLHSKGVILEEDEQDNQEP